MIMPTLLSVRKNSSSSSIAISGAGILPFMTPMSMICRGSTWPSSPLAGMVVLQTGSARQSASGARPTAPLNENGAAPPVDDVLDTYEYGVGVSELSDVAGSPGSRLP